MATCMQELPKSKALAQRYLSTHHMSPKETNSYACRVLKNLYSLWQDQLLCDVEIQVGSKTFYAHRNVLAAGSSYFNAMFTSTLVENDQKVITLQGLQPESFQSLLHFFYTGQIEVSTENCQDLMSAADMFDVTEVLAFCCEYLKQQLSVDNCIGIYIFAEAHACEDVLNAAEKYIYSHFAEVEQSEEFFDLPKETLIHFLSSEHLHVRTELEVFHLALRWLLHDIATRKVFIWDVMSPVRFPLIAEHQLQEYLQNSFDLGDNEHDISLSVICYKMYKHNRLKTSLMRPRLQTCKNIYIIAGFSRLQGKKWADGETLSCVEKFDTFEKQWKIMPDVEDARSGHGTAVFNKKVFVAGGEHDSLICDTVECFDPTTGAWSGIACMNFPRCNLALCADRYHLYAIGGWIGSELGATIEKYDSTLDQWMVCGKVNTLRYAMGYVEHEEGLFYLIGGADYSGIELKTTECYNPVTKEWTVLRDMPTRRSHVAVTIIDNYIYAVGGCNEHEGALDVVEKYCIDTDSWSIIPPMLSNRAGASVVTVDNIIYVFGGWFTEKGLIGQYMAPTTHYTSECYNPQTNKWTAGPSMRTGRCDTGIAVLL
ncbi:actin-binding protein IPP [Octopus vulgaris]|uniref:Actin-binding protein IPP n=2 Tax=Octopus TaxID=6643 RepID=A0AA36F5F7_OCTVU|nr:actin-binding protein IPP [Octopus sinensis]CAI9725152.1 actin-binding protein IPP [Octopus vulgaris]